MKWLYEKAWWPSEYHGPSDRFSTRFVSLGGSYWRHYVDGKLVAYTAPAPIWKALQFFVKRVASRRKTRSLQLGLEARLMRRQRGD